jgi:thiosulfate dehydrogenase
MYATKPLVPREADADDLYAYLVSLEPGTPDDVAFTPVRDIEDVPRGDAQRGSTGYGRACAGCHGELGTGSGRLGPRIPNLPGDVLVEHAAPAYTPRTQRLVFIEKTRHGVFLGYGGDMPPFSREVLSDAELGDVLEALGVLGE